MAPVIQHHAAKRPRRRVSPDVPGYFYPGEVARILGLQGIDYAQLRSLLRIVRPTGREPGRRWARFDLHDMACLRRALELAGGVEALGPGRQVRVAALRRACEALRDAGYEYPLVELSLFRRGSRLLAASAGIVFDPATGQLELGLLVADAASLARQTGKGEEAAAVELALLHEAALLRRAARTKRSASRRNGPLSSVQVA